MNLTRRQLLYTGTALGLAGCGSHPQSAVSPATAQILPPSPAPPSTGRLFVIDADAGSAAAGRLVLSGVSPDVVWFDDRPGRAAGRESTDQFVQGWDANGFASDPPNAVLQTGGQSLVVVLDRPSWDPAGRTLMFPFHRSEDQGRVPATFGRAAIFVDSGDSGDTQTATLSLSVAPNSGNGTIALQFLNDDVLFDFSSFQCGNNGSVEGLAFLYMQLGGLALTAGILTLGQGAYSADFQFNLVAQPGVTQFQLEVLAITGGYSLSLTIGSSAPQSLGSQVNTLNWPA